MHFRKMSEFPGAGGRDSVQRGSNVQRRESGRGRTCGRLQLARMEGGRAEVGALTVRTLEDHTVCLTLTLGPAEK